MCEMNDYVHKISADESIRIRRFLRRFAAGAVAFVLIVVLAIVFADRWILIVSSDAERRFIEPYVQWADEHLQYRGNPDLQAYVTDLAQQIAADMDVGDGLQLDFRVVNGAEANAFTTVGGYVYVFEGLLRGLESENSLAMVLAHEIAHARSRDPLLAASRGMLLQLVISQLSGAGVDPGTVDTGSSLVLNSYNREQEEAADLAALAALQKRYGHIGGATGFFEALIASGEAPQTMDVLSTHPNLASRVAYIESTAQGKGWRTGATTPYPPEIISILRN